MIRALSQEATNMASFRYTVHLHDHLTGNNARSSAFLCWVLATLTTLAVASSSVMLYEFFNEGNFRAPEFIRDAYWLLIIFSVFFGIIVAVLLKRQSQRDEAMWQSIRRALSQTDVDENLNRACAKFYEVAESTRKIRADMPSEADDPKAFEDAKANLAIWEAAVEKAKSRFWTLHDLYQTLGFEVQGEIGKYQRQEAAA